MQLIMPYFKNDEVNILFIHIPKAGGSSVEKYLEKKYSIKLNNSSLYGFPDEDFKKQHKIISEYPLQHYTYNDIYDARDSFNVKFNDAKIFAVVRNPYARLISDLFFFSLIKSTTDKNEIPRIIRRYIVRNKENHSIPQCRYITDKNGYLIKNITILRMESLKEDMIRYGYTDFNVFDNKNTRFSSDKYDEFLTPDVIKLVNFFYEEDFKYFDYDKIKI